MAETSAYLPKQINFTYWFIQSTPQPKSVRISYTLKQHRQTHADLRELLSKLTNWLDAYETKRELFPQVAASATACRYCNFAPRCGREQQLAPPLPDADLLEPKVEAAATLRFLHQIPTISI